VFIRKRKLTLSVVIQLIISLKTALQSELDSFLKKLSKSDFNIRKVTKGAFTQARSKLNEWAFVRLNEVAVNSFYEEAPIRVWDDMRVLAVDGTRFVLPKHKTTIEEFGVHQFGPKADSPQVLAMGSILYDVLNQIPIDAQLAPYQESERDLLMLHMEKIKENDMLLLDRGYPCYWLLFLLMSKKIHFCVRVKVAGWNIAKDFVASGLQEKIINIKFQKKDRNKLEVFSDFLNKEITCRLVRVELSTGEVEVLCTSLTDVDKYPNSNFSELYQRRWGVEEAFKLLKSRIELEKFTGKTSRAVKQDFHAKILLMTLCAAFAHPIENKVIEEYRKDEKRKHSQKINRTNALRATVSILIPMFFRRLYKKSIEAFDDIVYHTREIIRPGRNNKRSKIPKKRYCMNYKTL